MIFKILLMSTLSIVWDKSIFANLLKFKRSYFKYQS